MRLRYTFSITCLLAALIFCLADTAEAKGPEEKPNIVLFFADDLGWTGLRCFGSDFYETPNLDRLAESGMKFTDAYAACTVCSPSRAALMTGMYPAPAPDQLHSRTEPAIRQNEHSRLDQGLGFKIHHAS